MKNKLNKLKREAIPFIIVYILFILIVIGSFVVTAKSVAEGANSFDKISSIMSGFVPNITNFKFLSAIFVDFTSFINASFWSLLIFIGMFIAWKIKFAQKNTYDGIEHGSSDWSKNGEEFDKTSDGKEILNKKGGFILSKNHYLGTGLRSVLINKNVLVVGGSGSGKTACYVKPNILQCLGSYVITDPKGELYRDMSGFLKANGYEVKAFNLVNPEYSDRYNPLMHIVDHKSVDILAETIVQGAKKGTSGSNDPFWDDTAKMLLKACIYYVISVLPEEEQNISSCLNIIRAGGADDSVFKKLFLDELKPEHPGRKEYENFSTSADKTMQSIVISTIAKISTFDTPAMQKITTSNNINFDDLGKKKLAIFVITSTSDSTYDFISTMFFSQMLQKLFLQADNCGGTLKNQVYFLLDEFPNIGQIPDFSKKLSVTRSMGISISIIVQALDQLESLYKEQYEIIIGNCDTQIFLGSQSIKTCEYFSKSLGQKTITYKSRSVSKDKDEWNKQGVSISEQKQGRELMTIDELKRLDPNEEILVVRTLKPIKAKKYWYYKLHPRRTESIKYEIHDISEMPKTEDVEVKIMNVEQHLNKRTQLAKERMKEQRQNEVVNEIEIIDVENKSEQKQDINKPKEKEGTIDLQKELEKKFDELFGSSNNND
ncbi:MAG: type IV secretory system conjugative DNA transfer family protein [Clostridia bacterium]